jgi:hypothetical protein
MNTIPDPQRNRSRRVLLAIIAIFFGTFFLAGALRFSGWRPHGLKNKGELLQPPTDLRAAAPRLAAGGMYAWNPQARTWRILVPAPASCDAKCAQLAAGIDKVRALAGKDMEHVDILWLGAHPANLPTAGVRVLADDAAWRARLPGADDPRGTPVYVLDPNGFVVLRYAPGFELGDLRTDLSRLLKLG